MIGTKHVGVDITEFLTLMAHAPRLSHVTGEHAITPYMLFGARGVYSWFANVNAPYVVAWYDDIVNGRWEQARRRQERMHAFMYGGQRDTAGPGQLACHRQQSHGGRVVLPAAG